MEPQSEDSAVQDFLEILEEHRKNCERQGKYVEAEIAKNRLEELKLHEENRRRVIFFVLIFELVIISNNEAYFAGGDEISTNCRKIRGRRSTHVRISAI